MKNKEQGDILPPELRTKMLELSRQIKTTSSDLLQDRIMSRRKAIEAEGGNFDNVVPNALVSRFGWDKSPVSGAKPLPGLTDAERKEYDELRARFGSQAAAR
jgi:hypothetical protein